MHRLAKIVFVSLFFWVGSWHSGAEARNIPVLSGPVVDEARIFSPDTLNRLSLALRDYNQKTGVQLQVLTIESLEGDVLEDFSIRAAQTWKIGNEKTDRGLILLFVKKEREVRIEVGQGLEGDIPDALAGRIIDHIMIPKFRQGQLQEGIIFGLQEIALKLGTPLNLQITPRSSRISTKNTPAWFDILVMLIILFFFVFPRLFFGRKSGFFGGPFTGGSGFGGGGFSSGGWSGGGGGFSGGGASGRW